LSYLIVSRLAGSLTIEDIGISLHPGESKLISDQLYNSSKKIKEYEIKKWISTHAKNSSTNFSPYQITAPIPPAPIPPAPIPPAPIPPAPIPVPSVLTPAVQVPEQISDNELRLQSLVSKLENLLSSFQPNKYESKTSQTPTPQTHDEPHFIPSKILPDMANVHINVSSAESDGKNFDTGLEALKKARKKNE